MVHQMNAVTAAKRAGVNKPVFSHGHLSLQQILRDGPNDGDYVGALESARWKVIDEGVKSAEDGMVGICLPAHLPRLARAQLTNRYI
jgi:cell cycle arrest protein BUB2